MQYTITGYTNPTRHSEYSHRQIASDKPCEIAARSHPRRVINKNPTAAVSASTADGAKSTVARASAASRGGFHSGRMRRQSTC